MATTARGCFPSHVVKYIVVISYVMFFRHKLAGICNHITFHEEVFKSNIYLRHKQIWLVAANLHTNYYKLFAFGSDSELNGGNRT